MSTFVVQRGHVARSKGATGTSGEQAMARRNAAEILAIAKDLPDVTPRIIDADEPNARYAGDVFIALHGDASASKAARGASVGYRNDAGRILGTRWKTLYAAGGWKHGFRADGYTAALKYYYGTGRALSVGTTRAVIVEHGFMTNATERAFIDSTQGVKLAAAAAIAAAYPQYDLDRLINGAPEPEPKDDQTIPDSTETSEVIVTTGDTGSEVLAWQRQLALLLPKDPDAHRPDGHFGPKTARWSVAALKVLGLRVRDTDTPLIGPRSRAAMNAELVKREQQAAERAWRGKRVESKVASLNFYDSARWTEPYAQLSKGWGFPTIEARIAVGSGHQYRVRNSQGHGPYYLTAHPNFVRLV